MGDLKVITNSQLIDLIKINSRNSVEEEGVLDYDVFIGFEDGSYEGLEVDTSYHIMVSNKFLYSSEISSFLQKAEYQSKDIKSENAIYYISDFLSDGNVFELEDVDRVFGEYTPSGDNFIVVHDHLELLSTMDKYPGRSIVVEWSR